VASARTSTSGSADRTKVITAIAVVLVLAAAVIGGVLWQRSRSAPPALTQAPVSAAYPVALDGEVVVAGKDSAKVTVDVYEDFLCPACGSFEERDGDKIEQALTAGTLGVRYHILNMLDDKSNPPGYSLDAGSAALCAADAGIFPGYHASLFANQPREGGRGHTTDQLIQLGHDLGAGDSFDSCVRSGAHKTAVSAQLQAALADPSLRRPGPDGGQYFGTPTVVLAGSVVDLSKSTWLDDALRAAAG
jgi:protein-disulfide isomerase